MGTLEEFIIKKESEEKVLRVNDLEIEISCLEREIKKLQNTSVTPYSDSLSKHFPKGSVGFMGGRGAKIKSRELDKTIEHSNKIRSKEQQLNCLKSYLTKENKGFITRKNGLTVIPYARLKQIANGIKEAIKTKSFNNRELTQEEIINLKQSLTDYNRKLKDREKLYKSQFEIIN
ncbi:hypothetical protein [Elizabethkingia meningoseptica]|uniref:hypothetical protein n=1 Tax=Elizabethkingia meningoseptica TaxID=238 RepID=UPI0016263A79|nr:hypothetical protein [Elizabethkingia meningoseptica]MBG0512939.1 hypothetical protein [Elizabethkingia meningoseptica]MBG0515206.1 hypothetical protein [Elizabethkingia meningoseptica]